MWTVVRCPACNKCWGVQKRAKSCPHCGAVVGDDVTVVSTAENPGELQREVAIANMPEELRDEFRTRMPKVVEVVEEPTAAMLFECIRSATIDDEVTLERLASSLRGKGISVPAEVVADEAVAQGLLFQRDETNFILLQ